MTSRPSMSRWEIDSLKTIAGELGSLNEEEISEGEIENIVICLELAYREVQEQLNDKPAACVQLLRCALANLSGSCRIKHTLSPSIRLQLQLIPAALVTPDLIFPGCNWPRLLTVDSQVSIYNYTTSLNPVVSNNFTKTVSAATVCERGSGVCKQHFHLIKPHFRGNITLHIMIYINVEVNILHTPGPIFFPKFFVHLYPVKCYSHSNSLWCVV